MCLLPGYDPPYCRYKKKLLLYPQGFSLYLKVSASISYILASISYISKSQVFQCAGISGKEQNASMPAYQAKSKMPVCQHIRQRAKCQYASISGKEQNASMPAYHGKEQNVSMPAYHGKEQNVSVPAYHGKEQNVSMPAYQGRSKISVCRYILA
jgi:hypothetical protein